jgi:hypothetical protein
MNRVIEEHPPGAFFSTFRLGFRLGLAQASDAVAGLPLAAFLEQGNALEALEDISFCAGGAGGAQAAML